MKPKVSVIIPTFNRLDILPETLVALERQEGPRGFFEVLLIDDGSTDATWSFLGQFASTTTLTLNLRRQTALGPAAARNWGIEQAQGELALFLDADIIAQPDVVRRHWQRYESQRQKRCGWMGRIETGETIDRWQTFRWDEFALDEEGGPDRPISWSRYRTPNSAWPLALLREMGGFDARFMVAEDRELAYRLAETGAELFYDREILAHHHHLISYNSLIAKAHLYGVAAAKWYFIHPEDRSGLAERLGLYVDEMPASHKRHYRLKRLGINVLTLPLLRAWVALMRRRKLPAADRGLHWLYRYYVSTSFRAALKRYR